MACSNGNRTDVLPGIFQYIYMLCIDCIHDHMCTHNIFNTTVLNTLIETSPVRGSIIM